MVSTMKASPLAPCLLMALAFAPLSMAQAADGSEFTVTLSWVDDRKAVFATVESVDLVAARARIGGILSDLTIDEGDRVEKGRLIARVVDAKLEPRLAAAEARIESLNSRRKLAETALTRVLELRQTGAASQARLDEARTNLEVVDHDLAAMGAERAVIERQRTEGLVLAPTSGRVLRVWATNGTVVLPGETVATVAAETYVLRLRLPERHARFIEVGHEVLVGARGLAGVSGQAVETLRRGRIRQVYPELEQGRVVADAEVEGIGDFFVGERVKVYVGTGRRRAFVVPEEYLFSRHGLTFLRLKEGGEVVVQPGLPVPGGIEILSGVGEGDILLPPRG